MATTYIHRTPASGGSGTTFTISFWCKRSKLSEGNQTPFISHQDGSNYTWVKFDSSDQLSIFGYKAGPLGFDVKTNRVFKDVGAWYNICIVFDSTESTSTDRIKIYVNGIKETSFATSTYPAEDYTAIINSTSAANVIGTGNSGSSYSDVSANYFGGYLSHFHFVDGTAYQASTFGSTDSTSGIWKIITSPSVTYGTNGFFCKFENSSNMDLDSSPNALSFATVGTLTPSKDNPSNNYPVMNPTIYFVNGSFEYYEYGNLRLKQTGNGEGYVSSPLATMAMNTGKWYWETAISGTNNGIHFGAAQTGWAIPTNAYVGNGIYTYGVHGSNGGAYKDWDGTGNSVADWMAVVGTGDYIGIALDLDNGRMWIRVNGTWQNSGDPTSGATGTGALGAPTVVGGFIIPTTPNDEGSGWYYPLAGHWASGTGYMDMNFGNGYFGITSHGETNADAAGEGLFKYSVPTGFYTICSNNIKAYAG